MKPESMEKVVAVAGTLSGCTALVGCAAFVLGNQLAILGAAAGIILTAVCAGCLAGMQIGRLMAPVVTRQVVTEVQVPVYPEAPPAPRVVPVRPLRYEPLPHVGGPVETPMVLPVVKLPPTSGTFEMSKAHIDALNEMCDGPEGNPTVEIDASGLLAGDLEDSFATVPMRAVPSEDGERLQILRW